MIYQTSQDVWTIANYKAPVTVHNLAKDVKGWFRAEEGAALFNLAKSVRTIGEVVEIGSYRGRSTIYLAMGAPSPIFCIDPFTLDRENGPKFFYQTLEQAGLRSRVWLMSDYSWKVQETWNQRIKLLFVDGNHQIAEVRRDVEQWGEWVGKGGVMALHDFDLSGESYRPLLKIHQELVTSSSWEFMGPVERMTLYYRND